MHFINIFKLFFRFEADSIQPSTAAVEIVYMPF